MQLFECTYIHWGGPVVAHLTMQSAVMNWVQIEEDNLRRKRNMFPSPKVTKAVQPKLILNCRGHPLSLASGQT
jgi:hypothetical protein